MDGPSYIYHLGDWDPSGVNAAQKIELTLREMAPDVEIHFEKDRGEPRANPTVEFADLPYEGGSDSRSKGFGDISVELDAIPPTELGVGW